ncbi:MAG: BamA/TamA family outer membrane protein, partial [Rubrivivax sp.]
LQQAADDGDATARALVEQLQVDWSLPPGAPFRNPAWGDAKAQSLNQLRAAGYAAATWSGTAAEVDTDTRHVRIFVVADSGPLFRSGPLDIQGLKYHDTETVQNLAGFGPGTPLTETRLLDFQDRLRRSGLFDNASVTFAPDPDHADAAPLQVRLGEAPRQVWTFGVGISADGGPRVSVEHLHRRPFGWAAIAKNKVEWGRLRRAWDGELSTHPLPRQYRWLIGGTYEQLESDVDVVRSERVRIGHAQNTSRMDRILFVEGERSWRRLFDTAGDAVDSEEVALTLNHHGSWRRLDDLLLPTRGVTLSLQTGIGQARSQPGGSGPFGRLYGRFTGYWPIGGQWFGQARIELGQVFRRSNVGVPDSQQFRAGGDESVRGYAYRSLGPTIDGVLDSGDVLFTSSVELARPILARFPSLWGAVFIDAGNAAERFSDLVPAVGIGAGVRWRSPIGPLKVDLAWGEQTHKLRLHFSVGVAF